MKDLRDIEYEGIKYIDNRIKNGYYESINVKIGFYIFCIDAKFEPIIETVETECKGFFGIKYKGSFERRNGYKLGSIYFTCEFDKDYWNSLSAKDKLPLLKDVHKMSLHKGQKMYCGYNKPTGIVFPKLDLYDLPYKEEINQIITDFWNLK